MPSGRGCCDDVRRPNESAHPPSGLAGPKVRRRRISSAEGTTSGMPDRDQRARVAKGVVTKAVDAMNSDYVSLSMLQLSDP